MRRSGECSDANWMNATRWRRISAGSEENRSQPLGPVRIWLLASRKMSDARRAHHPIAAIFSLVVVLAEVALFANVFTNPPGAVDDLLLIEESSALLANAHAMNVLATPNGGGVTLAAGANEGTLTVRVRRTRFPFNEAIPSWNAATPPGTGLRVWMRVGTADRWSSWFEAGAWGTATDRGTTRVFDLGFGRYEYDSLLLSEAADRVEVKFELERRKATDPAPVLRLFALSYSNTLGHGKVSQQYSQPGRGVMALPDRRTTFTLPVKFRSQVVPNAKWIGRICAPASAAMAATAFGLDIPTQDLAAEIYDPVCDMFGVWNRVVQGGAQHGLRGYITRFRSWDAVVSELERGSVILCSIRFKYGEIPNPPRIYRRRGTEGHIVVLVGITPQGTLLVHDSASKDWGRFNEWTPQQLSQAWFEKGGVAMIFTREKPNLRP